MATQAAVKEYAINSAYTQQVEEGGAAYPSIMASDYQPKMTTKVTMGLPEASWDMLSNEGQVLLEATMSEAAFGEEVVGFYTPKAVRWIILNLPGLFVVDDEGNVERLERGMKLAGSGKKTLAKMFMCAIVGEQIILDDEGLPQVFSINLKSSKTALIGKAVDKEGSGSVWALNKALRAHWKGGKGSWYTQQVTVELTAKPEKFTSKSNDQSSIGVMFSLEGGARILSEENQAGIHDLLQDKELQATMADPFNISGRVSESALESVTIEDEAGEAIDEIDGIPF